METLASVGKVRSGDQLWQHKGWAPQTGKFTGESCRRSLCRRHTVFFAGFDYLPVREGSPFILSRVHIRLEPWLVSKSISKITLQLHENHRIAQADL